MSQAHPAGKGTDRRAYSLTAWDAGHKRIFGSQKKAGRSKRKIKSKGNGK